MGIFSIFVINTVHLDLSQYLGHDL
ncbi:erythromycin resistance leader peptide [Enterococcus faecium]